MARNIGNYICIIPRPVKKASSFVAWIAVSKHLFQLISAIPSCPFLLSFSLQISFCPTLFLPFCLYFLLSLIIPHSLHFSLSPILPLLIFPSSTQSVSSYFHSLSLHCSFFLSLSICHSVTPSLSSSLSRSPQSSNHSQLRVLTLTHAITVFLPSPLLLFLPSISLALSLWPPLCNHSIFPPFPV